MKARIYIITLATLSCLFIVTTSCESSTKSNSQLSLNDWRGEKQISKESETDIADSLVDIFINSTFNQDELNRDTNNVMYMKEDSCFFNDQIFTCYRIGFDLGFRFQVIHNVFIDSESESIYEYDVIKDSLLLWKHK